ncbi:MAG: bacillithiol biosynthesis deacetylase BshB1 [Cyclobacteriaceae bacterium]|jgi:bacillithiol biosynthesis deacetylase BshB1
MKLDILVFGAHPDDIELSCGGTIISHIQKGYKVGVVDLTQGELGTRGTPELRAKEATNASALLGLSVRENLGFRDGWFTADESHQMEIIKMIRKYRPEIVLANAKYDRHPDHGRGAQVVDEAFFKAGLKMIPSSIDGEEQEAWRPKKLWNYIQSVSLEPDFYVDISEHIDQKMQAVKAYASQFYSEGEEGPQTYISSKNFMEMLTARSKEYGQRINVNYAEGFSQSQPSGIKNLFDLL